MEKAIGSEKLGMTLEQMEEEIVFMRGWDKYVCKNVGAKAYSQLAQKYAREKSYEALRRLGASDEEAAAICNQIEKEEAAK